MLIFLNRIAACFVAYWFIKLGLGIIFKGGGFIIYGYYGDYSSYGRGRYVFAAFFIIVGISCIYAALRYKSGTKTDSEENEEAYMICPQCEETYSSEKITDGKCPQCADNLEPLEGYFERKNTALKKE